MSRHEKEQSRVKTGEGRFEPGYERSRYGHQPIVAGTRLDPFLEHRIRWNREGAAAPKVVLFPICRPEDPALNDGNNGEKSGPD